MQRTSRVCAGLVRTLLVLTTVGTALPHAAHAASIDRARSQGSGIYLSAGRRRSARA